MVRRPPTVASLGFLVLHVAGVVYVLLVFMGAWVLQLLLRVVMARTPLFQQLHIPFVVIPAGLALVALVGAIELRRITGRWRRREPEPDVGLRVRALAFAALTCVFVSAFFLSTPETFAGPFRVRFPITAHITAAFAYGAYTLWSLLLPRWRRVFPERLRHGLDVLAVNVALILVLAEIGLRVLAAIWPSPLLVTAASPSGIRREANRARPGTLFGGFPMNSGGHYDTEFVLRADTAQRIVVDIGDSFSYGAVPHYYHFTTVAERELPGVSIYNMGYSGIGPGEYLYLLEHEALPLDPDLVVINLFVGNDVTDGARPPSPFRWYDADSYLIAIVWHRLQIMSRAKLADAAVVTEWSHPTPQQLVNLAPHLADPLLETPSVSEELFAEMETRSAQQICMPHEGLYESFFQTLTGIMRAAGEVPLAFMVIPEEYQVEDRIWQQVLQRSAQPLDRDLAQRTIVAWLQARGQPVLDLLSLLRAVEPMPDGRRHVYHLQDTHFNTRGNDIAGAALADFVAELLPPPVMRRARGTSQEPRTPPPAPVAPHGPPPPLPAPVSLPVHLAVGDSTARQWMRSGWYDAEGVGAAALAWSEGDRSVLTVLLPRDGDIRMDFEALPFVFPRSPRQVITIALNGTVIEAVQLRPGKQKYSVVLPARVLRASIDTLEFRYAYARSPQEVLRSPDVRTLAVAWYSIDFTRPKP